uniref:Uncharacterized protein n=1 Tax=Knipowitschia caucasica TaxID=637954 RepID=A0AAV2L147_KNICA
MDVQCREERRAETDGGSEGRERVIQGSIITHTDLTPASHQSEQDTENSRWLAHFFCPCVFWTHQADTTGFRGEGMAAQRRAKPRARLQDCDSPDAQPVGGFCVFELGPSCRAPPSDAACTMWTGSSGARLPLRTPRC